MELTHRFGDYVKNNNGKFLHQPHISSIKLVEVDEAPSLICREAHRPQIHSVPPSNSRILPKMSSPLGPDCQKLGFWDQISASQLLRKIKIRPVIEVNRSLSEKSRN